MTEQLRHLLENARITDAALHGSCWGQHRNGNARYWQLELRSPKNGLLWKRQLKEQDYYEAVNFWLSLPDPHPIRWP